MDSGGLRASPVGDWLRRNASVVFVLALVAGLVHTVFADSGYLAMRRMQLDIERLSQEMMELHARNQKLAAEVHALKTDPETIERIAREEMGLAKPGELIFRLPPRPEGAKPDNEPKPDDDPRPDEDPQP